jgi:hypothetical protein
MFNSVSREINYPIYEPFFKCDTFDFNLDKLKKAIIDTPTSLF